MIRRTVSLGLPACPPIKSLFKTQAVLHRGAQCCIRVSCRVCPQHVKTKVANMLSVWRSCLRRSD